MSAGPQELSSVLASSPTGNPSKKGNVSSLGKGKKPVKRGLLFDDVLPRKAEGKGKENADPKENLVGIEQKIPKTFLSTKSKFTPYLFGSVSNLGEGQIYLPNRFMAKVQENEKTRILAELYDFDLSVLGYVAVQPPAFTKPIYIFGRSNVSICNDPIDNSDLKNHLKNLKTFQARKAALAEKLEKIKESGKGNYGNEKRRAFGFLEEIPKKIRGLYQLSSDSSEEQINAAIEEIQQVVDITQNNDMNHVYDYFMTLNPKGKKNLFMILNDKAKNQITLRLLRDAYHETCIKIQSENQDVHIWYVDDLSNFSKEAIKAGKSENLSLLEREDNAEHLHTLLFGKMEKKQRERICAEDKIAAELLKLRGITAEHIIAGGYYSLNSIVGDKKIDPGKRIINSQRYVVDPEAVDAEIILTQPETHRFNESDAIPEPIVVVNHIESCKVCTYLAKNDHEAKAHDPKTIPISISPSRAKKENMAPLSQEEIELFNSLIDIVSELPEEVKDSVEYSIRFLFSARDLLGVEGELTEDKIEWINLYLREIEDFIRNNVYALKQEDLDLFSKFVTQSHGYLRDMRDAVKKSRIQIDPMGSDSSSSILSDYSFFGVVSSTDSSNSLPDVALSSSTTLASNFRGS